MKYIVAGAKDGWAYYIDNKLYDHEKQANTRLKKLSDTKSGLKVWKIETFNLMPVDE